MKGYNDTKITVVSVVKILVRILEISRLILQQSRNEFDKHCLGDTITPHEFVGLIAKSISNPHATNEEILKHFWVDMKEWDQNWIDDVTCEFQATCDRCGSSVNARGLAYDVVRAEQRLLNYHFDEFIAYVAEHPENTPNLWEKFKKEKEKYGY